MGKWIFYLLAGFLLVGASLITTLPLVIVFLLLAYIFYRDSSVLVLAFVLGILLNVYGAIGETSMFLLLFVFVLSSYERKFGIDTYPFVLFASLIGSFLFLAIAGYTDYIFIESVIASALTIFIFRVVSGGRR
ncbi:hypothetical protein M1615_00985 [Patescibacteria group bacterium]|nr:hypothetical protein [Patescibacteria group bacterium]MCL5010418.1 hypothetical protein [Patescibacteria group bacterium]